jgi:hypothetical protein
MTLVGVNPLSFANGALFEELISSVSQVTGLPNFPSLHLIGGLNSS